jgi:uncharacterized protein
MNYLITGGTGLVGNGLVESLLKDGHLVRVLTRNPETAKEILPKGAIPVGWDAKTASGWAHVLEDTDAVVHLAGEPTSGDSIFSIAFDRWTKAKKDRILSSRVEMGHLLTEAIRAAENKPKVFLQASAIGYYSPSGTQALTEDSPAGTDFSAEVLKQSEASTQELEVLGVRRIITRGGLVFTREGGILGIMLLPFRMFVGGPLGDGTQPVPWVHIEDEIDAFRFLIENPEAHGPYNLATPDRIDYNDFAWIASKVLRRPSWFRVPAFLLRLGLGEKAELVLQGQQVVPQRLSELGFKFKYTQLENALQDLTS